jgi:hypothetical protein
MPPLGAISDSGFRAFESKGEEYLVGLVNHMSDEWKRISARFRGRDGSVIKNKDD